MIRVFFIILNESVVSVLQTTTCTMVPVVDSSVLAVVRSNTRTLFLPLFIFFCTFAVIANCWAIYATIKRKYKVIQKTCVISLAVTDITCALAFTITSVESFVQEIKVWTMGEFMCNFFPMIQLHTSTADTMILLVIALDRYYNIMYAKSKNFDPNIYICLVIIANIFVCCVVLAYPMFVYFDHYPIIVHYEDQDRADEEASICVSAGKHNKFAYYLAITILIFIPIMLSLIWFYVNIAKLIWVHRKPVSESIQQAGAKPKHDVQVERKMRAFRIILLLMVDFIILRLPFWIFYNISLSYIIPDKIASWNTHYSLTLLTVVNCALNPMLYTFLNETMYCLRVANDFVCKVFCCCISNNEFDELENRDNPFMVANNADETVKTKSPRKSTKSSKSSRVEGEEDRY